MIRDMAEYADAAPLPRCRRSLRCASDSMPFPSGLSIPVTAKLRRYSVPAKKQNRRKQDKDKSDWKLVSSLFNN